MNNLETYQTILEEQFSCNVGTFEEYATLEDFKFAYPTGDRIYIKSIPGSMDIMGVCSERCELSLLSNSLDDFTREVIAYSSKYIPSGFFFDTYQGTMSGSIDNTIYDIAATAAVQNQSGNGPFVIESTTGNTDEALIYRYEELKNNIALFYIPFETPITSPFVNFSSVNLTFYGWAAPGTTQPCLIKTTEENDITATTFHIVSGITVDFDFIEDREQQEPWEVDVTDIANACLETLDLPVNGLLFLMCMVNDYEGEAITLTQKGQYDSYPDLITTLNITLQSQKIPLYLDFQNRGKELMNGEWVSKLIMEGRWEL